METGDEIIIGRMGQQPMLIADATVDPQHALLRKTALGVYQIEDRDSTKGIFVFGMRIKRKTIKEDTPILLGNFQTTVRLLLQDGNAIDLNAIWQAYDNEKRQWDRKTMLVNYLRIIPSILVMLLSMFLGQDFDNQTRMIITAGLTVSVLIISMILSDRIMAKKNMKMEELKVKLQQDYVCPYCHRFLGFTPYKVLKQNKYCPRPDCNCPLP